MGQSNSQGGASALKLLISSFNMIQQYSTCFKQKFGIGAYLSYFSSSGLGPFTCEWHDPSESQTRV